MKLYLVQHGDAVPKEVDPQRPLSAKGRADVRRMASFLDKSGVRVARILHSGKKRAEQTAELLAASVGTGEGPEKASGIDPLDPTERLARAVDGWTEDTMVVGHLPFMGKLASHLVTEGEAGETAAFRPGTVLCLEPGEEGKWAIAWMIRPELLADRDPKDA
ncbi:MAG: phosphohistidine phosphatase SixA [Phycisphaerae bacterium]